MEYLAAIAIRKRCVALCGRRAFELPFLRRSVGPRYTGRREIAAFLHKVHQLYPNFASRGGRHPRLIETPEKNVRRYVAHARAAATGRTVHTCSLVPGGRGW